MDEEKKYDITEITDEQSLDKASEDIIQEIISTKSSRDLTDLTDLFNQNIKKKNMIRLLKFNQILDKTSDEALKRLITNPDDISTRDLINLIQISQKTTESTTAAISGQTTPEIKQNINVNINDEEPLSRESREKVINFIKMLNLSGTGLNDITNDVIDAEFAETEEVEDDK